MDQDNNQELDLNQKKEAADEQIESTQADIYQSTDKCIPNQLQRNDIQMYNLERQLLLNNNTSYNRNLDDAPMSNWVKVTLSGIAVFIPGLGQILGIILGLVFVSDDVSSDKRSYGAALITVSVVAFVLSSLFWFIFALTFGPQYFY